MRRNWSTRYNCGYIYDSKLGISLADSFCSTTKVNFRSLSNPDSNVTYMWKFT